ncbi:hypothetical protein [Cryptosporangium sp. NPDC048952]|uniref:hypothetical protein n=1 Tax=Cryptosporangium sp. NPDC048952 TaxID=3363961 RepID=UPI003722CB09
MRSAVKTSRRVRVLGAGLALAASVLATTGCGAADTVSESVKTAVQTPQQKLVAAAPTTSTEPFTYKITQVGAPEGEATDAFGAVNPPAKAYELTTVMNSAEPKYTLTTAFRIVDQKSWIKMKIDSEQDLGLPEIPDKWMPVDPAVLKSPDTPTGFKDQDEDPARLGALFTSTVDVTESSEGKFSGTIDYTKQPNVEIVSAAIVKALGEKAKAIPFTATVVDGKVTEFVLSIPATGATKAQTYKSVYEYGAGTPVAAPPAEETAPMPDDVVQLLNG